MTASMTVPNRGQTLSSIISSVKAALGSSATLNVGVGSNEVPINAYLGALAYSDNIVITKDDIGLGSVDNTSDADKPISTDMQAALDLKVALREGYALSKNDFSDALKVKLEGITPTDYVQTWALGALAYRDSISYDEIEGTPIIPVQVNANWQTTATDDLSYIQNKPNLAAVATSGAYADLQGKPNLAAYAEEWKLGAFAYRDAIDYAEISNTPAPQVNADWNSIATDSPARILNKPSLATIATSGLYSDLQGAPDLSLYAMRWEMGALAYRDSIDYSEISNTPTIPAAQIQSDWSAASTSDLAYIKNKPTLGTAASKNTGIGDGNVPLLDNLGKLSSSVIPFGITSSSVSYGNHTHTAYAAVDHTHSGYLSAVPTASDTGIGGIKTGYTATGKNYPVTLDGSSKAYVTVPWTDTDTNTTYTFGTGTSNGTISVTPSGGTAADVAVKGLGSAAYTASTDYASSTHAHNYAGSTSAGGAATSANKVNSSLSTGNGLSGGNYDGSTARTYSVDENYIPYKSSWGIVDGFVKRTGSGTWYIDTNTYATTSHTHTGYLSSVPAATSSAIGGIKTGYTQTSKNYPVELDASSNAYVNVPWTDTDTNTTYSAGTGLSLIGTSFSVSFGTSSTTACVGNDSRLSDARTPTAHTHSYAGSATVGGNATRTNSIAIVEASEATGAGKIYFNTNTNRLYIYNGSAWKSVLLA
jgi:hypothetical protein